MNCTRFLECPTVQKRGFCPFKDEEAECLYSNVGNIKGGQNGHRHD